MSEQTHIAEAVEGLFATPDIMWFTTYPAVVEGLSAEQSARSPGPRFNSVWAITLHLIVCQRYALALLGGENPDPSVYFAAGAWPPLPNPADETAWEQAKADLMAINRALASCAGSLPEGSLEVEVGPGQFKRYQYLQGHIAHNSYHLCEMITTRHMLGLWLEKT